LARASRSPTHKRTANAAGGEGKKTPAGEAGVFKQDDRHGGISIARGIKQHRSTIVQVDDCQAG
jgi:hypothetical protein